MTAIEKIPAEQIKGMQNCLVLDVRTGIEHKSVALKMPHKHVPLGELDVQKFAADHHLDKQKPVYLLCRSGARATKAAEAFLKAGYDNVHVIEGGIMACENCGIDVEKTSAVSLERQVRITIGSLVLIGVILGAVIHPVFNMLSGFLGAGLLFAGITDWCGLSLLLAKAPWNKQSATCAKG